MSEKGWVEQTEWEYNAYPHGDGCHTWRRDGTIIQFWNCSFGFEDSPEYRGTKIVCFPRAQITDSSESRCPAYWEPTW